MLGVISHGAIVAPLWNTLLIDIKIDNAGEYTKK